jgi:hypothetical protein
MSVLAYVHQLFDVDQCQAYIHTLRWQDRPLQCPRCQSQDVDPWGQYHYRPGCKRYWCHGCKRTSLNFSQFVEGRSGWPWAREGRETAYVFAGDAPCAGEEIGRASARFDALQTVIN